MRASLAYALLCAVALLAPALARVQLETPVGAVAGVEFTAAAADVAVAPQRLGRGRTRLELCDCFAASGDPGGLSCDREGFFIASFERQGQWVAGGGAVPLSRAVCCRPCLPDSLPPDPSGRVPDGQRPVAVVSLGCHASTDGQGVRCESSGGSLVSGFTDAVHVFGSSNAYYPVNTAQCCTPALLLESGDAWELERCECGPSGDAAHPVSCGAEASGAALAGFDYFRLSPVGQIVPVGPAKCCGVCLSESVHPIDGCADLDRCSGRGVCLLGRCECLAGWGGADCSLPLGGRGGARVPPWAIALIVIGSCVLALAVIGVAAHVAQLLHEGGEGGSEDGDASRPLLLRIDADDAGSVGAHDSDSGDEMGDGMEERIEGVIQRLEEAGSAGSDQLGAAADAPAAHAAGAAAAEPAERSTREAGGENSAPAPGSAEAGMAAAAAAALLQDKDVGCGAHLSGSGGVGPLCEVDCSVCMIRPVQTVLIPCGHVCMCRRCSRRLMRCPICRKSIARRQRLFL